MPVPRVSFRAIVFPLVALSLAWYYFSGQIERKLQIEQAQVLAVFRNECHDRTTNAQEKIGGVFRSLYEHLRTVARLPGVRIMAESQGQAGRKPASGLRDETSLTIREIFTNVAPLLKVTEFQVVPLDSSQPATSGPAAIPESWKFTNVALEVARATQTERKEDPLPTSEDTAELRQMREHLSWFQEHFEHERTIEGLKYPALCSREITTCGPRPCDLDNPDESERTGIVYSVPFFNEVGNLRGCISAVIPSHAVRGLLPGTDFVLVNMSTKFAATLQGRGTWAQSEQAWRAGQADPGLLYSACVPLEFPDSYGEWRLWSGVLNDRFWNRSDVRAAKQSAVAGHISLAIALFALGMVWFFLHQARIADKARGDSLELLVQERSAELLGMSRRAGMAEVASGLLHNIGNVMTSANVSVRMLIERMQASRVAGLSKAAALVREQGPNLGKFMSEDARGKQLPLYLETLATQLLEERKQFAEELEKLGQGVEHMIEILDSQRQIANSPAMIESISISKLAHSAVTLVESSMKRHGVALVEHFSEDAEVYVDHSRALQILVNLLTNAKDACLAKEARALQIEVRTRSDGQSAQIEVTDSGAGIAAENLTRMFSGRFTTKQKGRGIGLHFSAIAAADMGGSLKAFSDGPGRGATFVLTLATDRSLAEKAESRNAWSAA